MRAPGVNRAEADQVTVGSDAGDLLLKRNMVSGSPLFSALSIYICVVNTHHMVAQKMIRVQSVNPAE